MYWLMWYIKKINKKKVRLPKWSYCYRWYEIIYK